MARVKELAMPIFLSFEIKVSVDLLKDKWQEFKNETEDKPIPPQRKMMME